MLGVVSVGYISLDYVKLMFMMQVWNTLLSF